MLNSKSFKTIQLSEMAQVKLICRTDTKYWFNMNDMNMKKNKLILILCAFLLSSMIGYAQDIDNQFESRAAFKLTYNPIKKLKLSLSPELRFDENMSLDEYLIEAGAAYKIGKMFTLGANYRFMANERETKATEYYSRFAFYGMLKKKYGDFEPSLKFGYSNYSDDDEEMDNYLRYKASLKYDIPKSKITPVISAEGFHNLSTSELYKMRYAIGADYKLFKKNYIGLKYKFDYFRTQYKNRHIISLEYKIKL